MKQNKLITAMAIALSLSLASCSDDESKVQQQKEQSTIQTTTQTQSQSEIMSFVPADTPILAFYAQDPKYPIPQNLKDKMSKLYSGVGDIIRMAIQEKMNKSSDDAKKLEIKGFMDKWVSEEGMEKLGFSIDENEIAVYAVDLFPVVRMTLAKTHSMGEVLDDLLTKANESKLDSAIKKPANGGVVYQFGDKELQVMVSLKNNTIVASLAPTREVDNLMPKLLGFKKPAKGVMQSEQLLQTFNKYNYLGNSLYWLNLRQLADYFVNPAAHQSAMLDVLKVQDDMMSADCKTEILSMFDKFPRIVGGGTFMDEHKLNSHMIIEMPNGLGGKLSTITGRIPQAQGNPAIAYGVSFDVAAAKTLALEFVNNIETQPYKCEFLAGFNSKASSLKERLNQPLPPFVGNFKGVNVIVDELELDMTKKDPKEMIKTIKAKILLAVDNPEALQGMAEMMLPELQKLGIKIGGDAVNISSIIPAKGSQLPVNLDYVFAAMGKETIGISLGEDTNIDLTQVVSNESTSDLLSFEITAEIYKNIFAGLGEIAAKLPAKSQKQLNMQKSMMGDMLWWQTESATMDFTDRGFEVNVDIVY